MNPSKYLPTTWYNPHLALRQSPIHGQGLFATEPIQPGEVVMIWGGDLYTKAELQIVKFEGAWSFSMIEEGLFLFAPQNGWDYYVNHSCDPNLWMADEVTVVARRAIQPGDEICGDYAVWESDPAYTVAPCGCGTTLCRGRYTGDDWKRPELQARYQGHFLPYLNRRIAQLNGPACANA
jgi:uncharacterized protein